MPKLLYLDIETYSPEDLTKTGVYRYAEHPDHLVLMCGYNIDGGQTRMLVGEEQIRQVLVPMLHDPGYTKIAHNAQFDRVNLSRVAGCAPHTYLDPAQWDDTMAIAMENGLPASLKDLAKALGAEEKDEAGSALIRYFSRPDPKGNRRPPEADLERWQQFVDYGVQDVDTLVDVHQRLPDWPTEAEHDAWVADQRLNDAGILADVELARWALLQDTRNRESAQQQLQDLLGIENANSVPQLTQALKATGLDVPNLRVDTVRELLRRDDLTDTQRTALGLRAQIALAAAKKYQAVLNGVSADGRLRGQFKFYGAHTGRWSGRGVQLQNLPKAQLRHPGAVLVDSKLGLGASPQDLKALVRQVFVGPFVVADYSAIEARVLAWVAGEQWALDAFSAGRDIYVETAERMGGLTRQQGKVAVLALGYQGGSNSLRHMGAQGTDEELEQLKVQWRKANPHIVQFWWQVQDAFGEGGQVGRVKIRVEGDNRVVVLPSGRTLTYRRVKYERWRFTGDDGVSRKKEGWRFDGAYGRADTYGGRLAENLVQAISRDVLADLLQRLQDHGLQPVGHVHDEVLVQADPEDSDRILGWVLEQMSTPPMWACGLPLKGEGFYTERYRKG